MGKMYIFGRNSVKAALREHQVQHLFINASLHDIEIDKLISSAKCSFERVDSSLLAKLSMGGNHQGLVAEVNTFSYTSFDEIIKKAKEKKYPLILILAELNDPHNLGAIIRTADAFGVDGIVIKKTNQVGVTPTVIKVATGAQQYVPIAQVTNLAASIQTLKEAGFWIVASDGKANQTYDMVRYDTPTGLIVGSEGFGIPELLLKKSDFIVKIPMVGHVNSLNASVAAGILIAGIRFLQTNY
jgi:23S rRNA (guanosine2251-2'-O)-methyltransferase